MEKYTSLRAWAAEAATKVPSTTAVAAKNLEEVMRFMDAPWVGMDRILRGHA
jgi:hypothetical protein